MSDPKAPKTEAVRVYWRPGCPYCAMLRHGLKRTGLPVEWHDIWEDGRAAAYVRSLNGGNETVPTVEVAGRALTNPSAREVLAMVRAHAPHLAPAAGAAPRRAWLPWRRRTAP
ncbi:mycoredoxin [Streptomyces halobius]|uniref:Mycoredoxin n=1 Tax=Streptomyces halobius TaxID=2879846 RepID=A0ABY4M2G4_9ACTN|nr:mycoredoxin [Streptomyces halobius]UQA91955.1 mycoredoxin [Streptomyces halobius]